MDPDNSVILRFWCTCWHTIRDWNDLPDSQFFTAEVSDDCTSKCVLGTNFFPIGHPGEILSFGMSPVNLQIQIHKDDRQILL